MGMTDYYDIHDIKTPKRLSVDEAAIILQVSSQTLQRLIDAGEFPKPINGHISRKEFLNWLVENEAVNIPVHELDTSSINDGTIETQEDEKSEEVAEFSLF
jgi:predicted DNA-binding transcriptional regulator AlpA